MLLVIGASTLVVLVYWLLQGKRGALLAVIFSAFLLSGTRFARTVDPSDLDSVPGAFLFGALAAGVAFLAVWLLSRWVDTTRERRRARS